MQKRNAAICRKCNTRVESKYTHDFQRCRCGAIFVDGGTEYIRRGGNPEDFLEIEEAYTYE